MALTLRKALSANIINSCAGLLTQAATAPLYLMVIRVDQFAQWIYLISISAFVSLALNGYFYAIMNELTTSALEHHRGRTQSIYNTALAINALAGAALGGFLAILWLSGAAATKDEFSLLVIAVLIMIINLTSIMFDANFRSMDRYQYGTNVLTVMRTIEWIATFGMIVSTRDVGDALIILLIYKILAVLVMLAQFQARDGALKLDISSVRLREAVRFAKLARGQLLISASTATSTMGPQIVVSAFLGDVTSVAFNTSRTYLRLIAALVTVLTSAAWPIISRMHAEGRIGQLEDFMTRLMFYTMAGACLGGVILIAAATPVFTYLFGSKVHADHFSMTIMFLSVLLNCGIGILQSLYLSTNLVSGKLLVALVASSISVGAMGICARFFGFLPALFAQVGVDLLVFMIMQLGVRLTFDRLRLTKLAPEHAVS